MLKLKIAYPSKEEENLFSANGQRRNPGSVKGNFVDKIMSARKIVADIYMDSKVEDYIVNIVLLPEPQNCGTLI